MLLEGWYRSTSLKQQPPSTNHSRGQRVYTHSSTISRRAQNWECRVARASAVLYMTFPDTYLTQRVATRWGEHYLLAFLNIIMTFIWIVQDSSDSTFMEWTRYCINPQAFSTRMLTATPQISRAWGNVCGRLEHDTRTWQDNQASSDPGSRPTI